MNEQVSQTSGYDAFKRPPDLEVAKQHASATRFAKPLPTKSKLFCPCCGLPVANEELDIKCGLHDMGINGQGVPLFFEFIGFNVVILTILAQQIPNSSVISGLYNTVVNRMGEECFHLSKCTPNFYNLYSFANRGSEEDVTQYILDLAATVAIIAATIIYRKYLSRTINEIDNQHITVSDFSIQISNLPLEATEEEIKKFFSKIHKNDVKVPLDLVKINLGYNLRGYYNLQEQKLRKEVFLTQLMNSSFQDQSKIEKVESEITQLKNELQNIESNFQQYCQFSGVAFITYNKTLHARRVRSYFNNKKIELMMVGIASVFITLPNRQFKGQTPYVERATEPGDILWQNLGVDYWVQFQYYVISNLATLVILGICFASIMGISTGQDAINLSYEKEGIVTHPAITVLGLASSFVIIVLNTAMYYIIRRLVYVEENYTQTEFNISLAQKLGFSQFINTAIIPLLVNLLMTDDTFLNRIVDRGGLNSDALLILISNSITPWVMSILNPIYLWKMFQRKEIIQTQGQNYTQIEANLIFEEPVGDLSDKYAIVVKTLMLTMFYAQLLPLGIYLSIGFYIVYYWVEKRNFIKRYSRGPAVGAQLAEKMVDVFIEFSLVLFSVGNCIWQQILVGRVHPITWVQLAISIAQYVIPVDYVIGLICPDVEKQTKQTFNDLKNQIWDDYSKRNPVTMQKAIEEWLNENLENDSNQQAIEQVLEKMKRQNEQNLARSQHGVMKKIATQIHQKRRGQRRVVPANRNENNNQKEVKLRQPQQIQNQYQQIQAKAIAGAKAKINHVKTIYNFDD